MPPSLVSELVDVPVSVLVDGAPDDGADGLTSVEPAPGTGTGVGIGTSRSRSTVFWPGIGIGIGSGVTVDWGAGWV